MSMPWVLSSQATLNSTERKASEEGNDKEIPSLSKASISHQSNSGEGNLNGENRFQDPPHSQRQD
jgi:hypothetical protein